MSDLTKQYKPADHESQVYQQWEDSGAFAPDQAALDEGQDPYVIMLPPPNITGVLHLGHALQDTIMDILSRFHRMNGEPVLWQPGTDSAAIATNRVIAQQLHDEGTDRHTIGRDAFNQRVAKWYQDTGVAILNQMKRLGCSCDWQRDRFTLDEPYINSVNQAFIRFYNQGYIYRGHRIVNWDPATQTTVSDLEIDWHTEQAPFYTFKYGPFAICTARPETKFGDKYLVMHPDDKRYQEYKHGDTFEAEWINGPVTATIIKDAAADPEFGTGVMTITPWHDTTDFDIAQRHKLDMEQIIDFDGKLLPIAGEFAGQDIEAARPHIVKKLEEKGLLVSINDQYEHNLARNDRGKGTIEPQVMRQWFVDMDQLKQDTIYAVEQDHINFVPPRWKKHLLTWMNNVHDWNINRQIWLGHQLPVWWKPGTHGTHNEEGNFVVSVDKPDGDYQRDPDVLDTWFATALWPIATLGWPDNTTDLQTFYPTSVLVTGNEILYLWVARMIFSGLDLMAGEDYGNLAPANRIPFKDVFIYPTVLTKDGRRMSKSLGTGIDPLELIDQHGADALRFGLINQMSFDNQAIKFDEGDVTAGRNFANKVWNLARLLDSLPEREEETSADLWISSRLAEVQTGVTELINQYRLGEALHLLYDFVWRNYADWYVEIVKVQGSTSTARQVFHETLRLLHPFIPHLTEVLWQHYYDDQMLMTESWPKLAQPKSNQPAQADIVHFQDIVGTTRQVRQVLGLAPAANIDVHLSQTTPLATAFEAMCRAKLQDSLSDDMKTFPTNAGQSVSLSSPDITADTIKQAINQLQQDKIDIEANIERQTSQLDTMTGHAPDSVIAEKTTHLKQLAQRLTELENSLAALS